MIGLMRGLAVTWTGGFAATSAATLPSFIPHLLPGCWFFQLAIKYGIVPDTVYMIHINTLPETKCVPPQCALLRGWRQGAGKPLHCRAALSKEQRQLNARLALLHSCRFLAAACLQLKLLDPV